MNDPHDLKMLHSIRTLCFAAIAVLHAGILCLRTQGAPGDVDLSFDAGSGINGPVLALAIQPDGRVIIGGGFTVVKGLERVGIARLNTDGSGDSSFTPASGEADCLALQPDGKVLVGNTAGIRRLHADGSLDTGFMIPTVTSAEGFARSVRTVTLQPDGRILIGGGFRFVDGTFRSGVARLHADGTLDNTFTPVTIAADITTVFSIAVQADGKVLLGGQWLIGPDVSIVRLNADGSLDDSFLAETDGSVSAVELQMDGKVLVGGSFGLVNGVHRIGLARLSSTGATDLDFTPGAAVPVTLAIAVQPDGSIITGRASNGVGSPLTRFNADGSVEGAFDNGTDPLPTIYSIAVQGDGKILAGGADRLGNHAVATYHLLTRFNADRSRDGTFVAGGGVEGHVFSLLLQPDGRVIIGGDFAYINGVRRNGVARLNPDGSLDLTFVPAPDIPIGGYRVLLQPDGKVLVGGARSPLHRLNADGSIDDSFVSDESFVLLALQPDGRLIVRGPATVNGSFGPPLLRLNSNGSVDSTFAFVLGHIWDVRSIAFQPDGKLLIAGRFRIGGEESGIHTLCRLNADGSLDGSFLRTLATDSGDLYDVILRPDGKLMVSGDIRRNGWAPTGIARLQSDGSVDATFDAGPEARIDLAPWGGGIALQPDGKVLVAGGFHIRDTEQVITGAFRLNANGGLDGTFKTGPDYYPGVNVIALQPDGNVLIAGAYRTINGVSRPVVARLFGDSRLPLPFIAWAESFGLSGAAAAANGDPDQDGVKNAVEYILGGNPNGFPDAVISGQPVVTVTGDSVILTFSRDDASEAPGTALAVETGTDLRTWLAVFNIGPTTQGSSPGVSISENGAGPDTITVAIPMGTDKVKFARVAVTITP